MSRRTATASERAQAFGMLAAFVGPIVLWSWLLPESWGAWMWLPVFATWAAMAWAARWVWRRVRPATRSPLPRDYLL